MHLDFSPSETKLRQELRAFLATHLPPDWTGIWKDEGAVDVSDELNLQMANHGWLAYYWPTEFGGRDGSIWDQVVIQEELFARHEPRGGQYMGVNWIGPVVMEYGTAAQKEALLPEITEGRAHWAQLFSEPEAGSDLAGVRTRAVRDGDSFLVNGEKLWTSYANTARRGFLLARTEMDGRPHEGLTVFLIDMNAPGIEVREIKSMIGWHRFHGVSFTDVRVPASSVLGAVDGGWEVAMAALPFERVGNARYARSTRILNIFDDSRENDDLNDDLADAVALGRMAELLNYRAAYQRNSPEGLQWEASAAFAGNAVYEQTVAALIEKSEGFFARVSGGDSHAIANGEVESFAVKQAPTVTIQAGTYQIQLSIIARQALGFPRAR